MRKTSFQGHIFDISEGKSITDALFTDGVYNENNFASILSIASKTLHRFTHDANCHQYVFISSVILIINHNILYGTLPCPVCFSLIFIYNTYACVYVEESVSL